MGDQVPFFTNYSDCLSFLYSALPMYQRVGASAYKKDLHNTLWMCQHLGHPETKFKSIHIAGTNGKGSTAHTIAAILQAAGYKTGLYTSPHLKDFTERIKINGQEVPHEKVLAFVNRHHAFMKDIQPSFFEWTVAMAFHYFAEESVDIAVIEVGMGGRLDSTNVIRPELSIITNISYDHKPFLGDTLWQIASEKAGVIKKGIPVVISEFQAEVWEVFQKKALEMEAPLFPAWEEVAITAHPEGGFAIKTTQVHLSNVIPQLKGAYQKANLQGIVAGVQVLRQRGFNIPDESIKRGIEMSVTLTGLKGRWQILQEQPLVICDTAHNEAGVRQVIDQLTKITHGQLHLILGMVADKEVDEILELFPRNAQYWFCQAQIPRAMEASVLAELAHRKGLQGKVVPMVNEALKEALSQAGPEDVIFVGGSTFTVAELENL
jgi:dihydrofolate synthase / folylpolyglutamate synthase